MKQKIPKIIHFCWFGGKKIPDNLQKCIESWKKYCPGYEIKMWNETNFNLECNDYVKEAYENKKYAFVSDYARLYIIYNYGGIYLDTDVEILKSFDDLLYYDGFIGFEEGKKSPTEVNTGLGFGAKRNLKIIGEMLHDYDNKKFINSDKSLNLIPCPQIQTKILLNHGLILNNKIQTIENLTIFPTEYFCPMNQYTGKINITKNTYSIHRYCDSWNNKADQYRRELRMKYSKYGWLISNFLSSIISYNKYYGFFGVIKEILRKMV